MFNIAAHTRIFLCQIPINRRKSFEGLSAVVEEMFPGKLLSGALFIFLNRRRDQIKVLYWDGDGWAIWFKRLEKGSFLRSQTESAELPRREFLMLLEGVTPKRMQPRFSL